VLRDPCFLGFLLIYALSQASRFGLCLLAVFMVLNALRIATLRRQNG